MTITQQTSSRPDFREQAKVKDVPVARLIGFEAEKIGEGRAAVVLTVGPQHANPMGTLHVSILCDIADAAMGMAFASTLGPDESSTTVELKINFSDQSGRFSSGLKESSYSEGGPSVTSR